MSDLIECIESLQPKLEKHRNTDIKETPTRTIFIDPILLALGWDVRNWDDIQLEYPTIDGKSVDYAAKVNEKSVLLIEAKALDDPLTDVKAITQVVGYAANDGIEWCILTNGAKYKVYCTRQKGAAPEKLLFEVCLDSKKNNGMTNQEVAQCLLRFSKDAITNGVLDKLGEEIFTKSKIIKALDKMFQNPPKTMIRELRDLIADDSVKPAQVQRIVNEIWSDKNGLHVPIETVPQMTLNIIKETTGPVRKDDEVTRFFESLREELLERLNGSLKPEKNSRWAGVGGGFRYYHFWYNSAIWENWGNSYKIWLYDNENSDDEHRNEFGIYLDLDKKYLLTRGLTEKHVEEIKTFLKKIALESFKFDQAGDEFWLESFVPNDGLSDKTKKVVLEKVEILIRSTKDFMSKWSKL
jgi:predicted type IV restriction endonuclease